MRKIYICLFSVIFVCTFSCNGQFLSSQKSFSSMEPFPYCSLLHVPSGPYPAPGPKPYLGIYLDAIKIEGSFSNCTEGIFVKVAGVMDGTPAVDAGLREDDVIMSLNGNPACRDSGDVVASFKKMIEQQIIGQMVTMDILRGNQKFSLTAKLAELPIHHQPEAGHRHIEECPDSVPSMLETVLHASNAFPLFKSITDGLYFRSNIVHNPGQPDEQDTHPLQLKEMTYMIRHPLTAGEVANELSRKLIAPLHEKDRHMKEIVLRSVDLLDLELTSSDDASEFNFPELVRIIKVARDGVELALSNVTRDERALLLKNALEPWENSQWNTISEISMKIDRGKLFNSFPPLLSFLSQNNLSLLKKDLIKRFGNITEPVRFEDLSHAGKVIIGGVGPDIYSEDADLILDLGGDDIYLNNAGGTRVGIPVALVIDWEGNDHYLTKENFSQGAGVLGGGFLIDLSGNDTFVSLDGSQGAGFWGMGILYHGSGNGAYNARSFCQGAGQMGLGLIINEQGHDRYVCSYGGQALGMFGGAGILMDRSGEDFYQLGGLQPDFRDPARSTVSMGQGFGQGVRPQKGIRGIPGGIGLLIDEKGDDTYIADYFAQGSSYYYGSGILIDMDGDDEYVSGRYSQGAGIHSSVGVCIDKRGNDFYYASFGVAQGTGHDFGAGFFEDEQGDDQYWGGTLVQGSATNGSIGVFKDLQGSDRYTCMDKGQVFAQERDGMGIMIGPAVDLADKSNHPASIRLGITR